MFRLFPCRDIDKLNPTQVPISTGEAAQVQIADRMLTKMRTMWYVLGLSGNARGTKEVAKYRHG